jgi:hypothetical protein
MGKPAADTPDSGPGLAAVGGDGLAAPVQLAGADSPAGGILHWLPGLNVLQNYR